MNILFSHFLCFLISITECCMRTIPPDDVYISSTLPFEETTTEMMTTMETSTMTEKVCPEMPATTCMDLIKLGAKLELAEVDGCQVVQCTGGQIPRLITRNSVFSPKLYAGLSDATIVFPVPPTTLAGFGGKSFFDYYGLICDTFNGNFYWTMTKYPDGLIDLGGGQPILGSDGSYDGKQAPIEQVDCQEPK
ncbi:DUF281 domain-containing protein [Caenorhabditis elegans]|uniref:DUF281 domain-containing protein n=1 Tax=Caenorhabditis elegans TaxID=6239 RepID=P91226_CAEEL|nr:DUF281 domain-containing protein [Caenorhabditis elegans]CCD61277.2 DUF281 domain-containing protein [Caenorhabditis elegans]|eukprot:NP_494171.2 Uncharacterized protein CELE_F07E5.7 [Caenorhabditis elegans]